MTKASNKTLKITLKKSVIGVPETQKKIVRALGITKLNQTVTHKDNVAIRGMVNKIPHLVALEEN